MCELSQHRWKCFRVRNTDSLNNRATWFKGKYGMRTQHQSSYLIYTLIGKNVHYSTICTCQKLTQSKCSMISQMNDHTVIQWNTKYTLKIMVKVYLLRWKKVRNILRLKILHIIYIYGMTLSFKKHCLNVNVKKGPGRLHMKILTRVMGIYIIFNSFHNFHYCSLKNFILPSPEIYIFTVFQYINNCFKFQVG